MEKGVADSHPEELRARDIAHNRVRHPAVERARSRESGALFGCAPFLQFERARRFGIVVFA